MTLSKQTVMLPEDVVRDIQQSYLSRGKSVRGALQDTLLRGATLALAELRGVPLPGQIGQDPQQSVKTGTLSEFEGLTAEEAEDLRLFLDMLRNGDERDRQMARFGVESWKARKAPQENVRAASQQPAPKKKTKSKGSDPRQ
jgi:hypothetical protein